LEEPTPVAEPHVELVEDPPPPKPPGFWKRQYSEKVTIPQRIFDVLFGMVVPVLLLFFDPIVFHSGNCPGMATGFAMFVYSAVALGIIALAVWLVAGSRLGGWAALLAGSLLTGGLFAAGIGLLMSPLSVLGLALCVGALGFIPFITGFVYHRNGLRAYRQSKTLGLHRGELIGLILTGILLVTVIPGLIQLRVTTVIRDAVDVIVENSSPGTVDAAIQDLKTLNTVCLGLCTPTITDVLIREPHPNISGEEVDRLHELDAEISGVPYGLGCSSFLIPASSQAE
jgi:hypothetical protein